MADEETEIQINQCIHLLEDIFKKDLLAVYLYGSSIAGGLQKYSDIDLFVILDRASTLEEKTKLSDNLLRISGIYMASSKLPIEITIVVHAEINPWRFPPVFDYQYGDWLRKKFECGIVEPWSTKEMPDLAVLITQVLLASKTLLGPNPNKLLCKVPYNDFIIALTHSIKELKSDLKSDTRNVLLTYARIWSTLETDTIRCKPSAASWAIDRLPKEYQPVMDKAKAIYIGEAIENWDDCQPLIIECAKYMEDQINKTIALIDLSNNADKSITLAE